MGEHTGRVTVYRAPRGRWRQALLRPGGTLGLYGITVLGLFLGRLLLLVNIAGAVVLGAGIAVLWIGVWAVRRTTDRVRITDRYHWDQAERAGTAVIRFLPATGLMPASEVRAVVQRELREIADLLVEQDRLLEAQRGARRAAADLPVSEPVRSELDDQSAQLTARLQKLTSLVEGRTARLARLADQATDLATLEARRQRARQAVTRVRRELRRQDAVVDEHQMLDATGEAVERAETILAAYRELTQPGATSPDG